MIAFYSNWTKPFYNMNIKLNTKKHEDMLLSPNYFREMLKLYLV